MESMIDHLEQKEIIPNHPADFALILFLTLLPITLPFCFLTPSLYFPLSSLSCLFTWVQVIFRNTKY